MTCFTSNKYRHGFYPQSCILTSSTMELPLSQESLGFFSSETSLEKSFARAAVTDGHPHAVTLIYNTNIYLFFPLHLDHLVLSHRFSVVRIRFRFATSCKERTTHMAKCERMSSLDTLIGFFFVLFFSISHKGNCTAEVLFLMLCCYHESFSLDALATAGDGLRLESIFERFHLNSPRKFAAYRKAF